ncbi:MAG: hypothetical protein QXH42_05625 [Thermoplasmata archaeon]
MLGTEHKTSYPELLAPHGGQDTNSVPDGQPGPHGEVSLQQSGSAAVEVASIRHLDAVDK